MAITKKCFRSLLLHQNGHYTPSAMPSVVASACGEDGIDTQPRTLDVLVIDDRLAVAGRDSGLSSCHAAHEAGDIRCREIPHQPIAK